MKNAPECNGAAVAMQRPKTRYGKVKLRSLSDLDGRTAAAREALALIERMQTALGGDLTAQEHQLVQRSAMLGVVTADFEARWVAGEQIPLSDYLAACRTQARILLALGLSRRARDVNGDVSPVGQMLLQQQKVRAHAD